MDKDSITPPAPLNARTAGKHSRLCAEKGRCGQFIPTANDVHTIRKQVMAAKPLLFLNPRTVNTSTRQHELANAQAKSHAARISQERRKARRNKQAAHPTPFTILRTGNSDPFASYAIPITPKVNEIVEYFSTYYANAAHQPHTSAARFLNDVVRQTTVTVLQHECSAQAFLLSFVTLRSNFWPDDAGLVRDKIQLSRQALTSLRANMHNVSMEPDAVLTALKFLFMAAAFAGSIFEATMHGTMLRDLLHRKWRIERQSLDHRLLCHVIYVDGQLAVKHLTHSIFDMDWVERALEPALAPAEAWLYPYIPSINDRLHRSIDDPSLRELFAQLRQSLFLLSHPTFNTAEGAAFGVWIGTRTATISANLANYYQMVHRRLSTDNLSAQDRFALLTRCAAVLALMELVNTPESMTLYRVNIPNGHVAFIKLQETLVSIQEMANGLAQICVAKYENAHLFALFIGAQAEQRGFPETKTQQGANPFSMWFNRAFTDHACQMGLRTWTAVRGVLECLVYFDVIEPHGSKWVDEGIGWHSVHNDRSQSATNSLRPQQFELASSGND